VFVHIVSALALFLGYGLEWTVSALLRHSSTTDQARAWLRVYRVSPPVTGAALAVLILSGGWLAALTGGMYHAWLIVSVAGIVVALMIGFALILPRVSAIREALPEGNLPLSPEALLQLQSAALPTLIRVRALLAVGIVYLMITKPPLGASLMVLAASMVLGVLFSVTSWSRGSSSSAAA
jgi:fatty acid desaturase